MHFLPQWCAAEQSTSHSRRLPPPPLQWPMAVICSRHAAVDIALVRCEKVPAVVAALHELLRVQWGQWRLTQHARVKVKGLPCGPASTTHPHAHP
jgi:hypothetical protein